MAVKIFRVLDKVTKSTRLVKAETRGQVAKFLASQYVIEPANAMDVAELLGTEVRIEDATAVADDGADAAAGGATGEAPAGEPAAGSADGESIQG